MIEESGVKVWCRIDKDAKTYRTTLEGGPLWKQVFRRVTFSDKDGKVIEDIEVQPDMSRSRLYKRIPGGPITIRTEIYVRDEVTIKKTEVVDEEYETAEEQEEGDWVILVGNDEDKATSELISIQQIMQSSMLEKEGWKQAFQGELDGHAGLQVHNDISQSEALRLQALGAEILPAKGVCTLKPPNKKKKAQPPKINSGKKAMKRATRK